MGPPLLQGGGLQFSGCRRESTIIGSSGISEASLSLVGLSARTRTQTRAVRDFWNLAEEYAVRIDPQQHVKFARSALGSSQNYAHSLGRHGTPEIQRCRAGILASDNMVDVSRSNPFIGSASGPASRLSHSESRLRTKGCSTGKLDAPLLAARIVTSGILSAQLVSALPGTGTKALPQPQEALTGSSKLQRDGNLVASDLLSGPGRPLRVAVDVDEVLGSFLATLNIFCAETYSASHDISEFFVYDFRKIWNCSQAEANHRVHQFFDSEHFTSGIPPIPGALEVLQRLSEKCNLVIVTSRQHVIRQPTLDWIEQHYPGIFQEVHFGNHFALEGVARPKSEICKSLGAELLIDDNPRYAMECAEHGIRVLLFDWNLAYPWSKTEDGPTHSLITRVKDWHEVEAALKAHVETRK